MLEVCFGKLLHSDGRSLEKDSLFVGPLVIRGLGTAGGKPTSAAGGVEIAYYLQ